MPLVIFAGRLARFKAHFYTAAFFRSHRHSIHYCL